MKKRLLTTLLLVLTAVFVNAQIIIDENFDSYTVGDKVAQTATDNWTTWSNAPGGSEDGTVSSMYASSGLNSMFIAKDNDLVLLFGDSTSGIYELTMKLYMPSDSCTYFNVLHSFSGGTSTWAADFYGLRDSTFHLQIQGNDTATAAFNPNTWHNYKLEVNMNTDVAKLFLNGSLVFEWPWTITSGDTSMGPMQLGAADFYGNNTYNDGQVGTFIDDIKLEKIAEVSVPKLDNELELNIFPNPSNNEINIYSTENMKSIRVYNIAGSEVIYFAPKTDVVKLDISSLSNGLYYVSVNYGNKIVMRKIVKK